MFSTFPEDARWNAERQAVEFGSGSASTATWSGSGGGCFNGRSRSSPPPSGASKPSTSRNSVREHRRAEAAPTPVDRGFGSVEISGLDLLFSCRVRHTQDRKRTAL
jgi:hypothetical protein